MACGKVILFGEHAVVYGHPAIAVPVISVQTHVNVRQANKLTFTSGYRLTTLENERLESAVRLLLRLLGKPDSLQFDISSTVPIGAGMGSSASLSVALIDAMSSFFSMGLSKKRISELALECEKIYHGTPSGIDTSVITWEKPIYFRKGVLSFLDIEPFELIIADTGIKGSTRDIVEDVRKRYAECEAELKEIGTIAEKARPLIECGQLNALGNLMTENHRLLKKIGVSCNELDMLVDAALNGGALGAKLAGAGRGGCIIALVDSRGRDRVRASLKRTAQIIEAKVG